MPYARPQLCMALALDYHPYSAGVKADMVSLRWRLSLGLWYLIALDP